ncbi:MAG: carbonic anhydrase [Brachybacterium sp.]|nr:carbonic anhydrase [Brachybacterium sp.]
MSTTSPSDQAERDPQAALERLLDGNRRFVADTPHRPNQSMEHRQLLGGGQTPFAAVLGCADSRVSVELLFDQGFGDLFVVRNAGQVLGRGGSAQASIEFAVEVLGVQVVLVLGHERCGAVSATVDYVKRGARLPGAMEFLVTLTKHHLDPEDPARDAVDRHVLGTVQDLLSDSDLVRTAQEVGRVLVAGGVYDLDDGSVRLLAS